MTPTAAPDGGSAAGAIARAQALVDLRRYEEARPWLARAVAADPSRVDAYCLLGLVQWRTGDPDGALRVAEQGVGANPSHEWPHRLRSAILLEKRKWRAALDEAREAARLAPTTRECLHQLARAEWSAGKRREAEATAERLREMAPGWASTHELLGQMALQRRRWRECEEHYRRALALDPRSWLALNNLAVALQRQGREKEALELFEAAARADPENQLVHRNLKGAIDRTLSDVGLSRLPRAVLVAVAVILPGFGLLIVLLRLIGRLVVHPVRRRQLSPQLATFYRYYRRSDWFTPAGYVARLRAGDLATWAVTIVFMLVLLALIPHHPIGRH